MLVSLAPALSARKSGGQRRTGSQGSDPGECEGGDAPSTSCQLRVHQGQYNAERGLGLASQESRLWSGGASGQVRRPATVESSWRQVQSIAVVPTNSAFWRHLLWFSAFAVDSSGRSTACGSGAAVGRAEGSGKAVVAVGLAMLGKQGRLLALGCSVLLGEHASSSRQRRGSALRSCLA